MSQKKYRVIQWATGTVGKVALKHFIQNPVIELVGVYVTNPQKIGKDAGELVGLPPTGVIATNDVEKLIALQADCVFFAAIVKDLDLYCRLLRSGKNVVSPAGPFIPTQRYRDQFDNRILYEVLKCHFADRAGGPLNNAIFFLRHGMRCLLQLTERICPPSTR